MGKKKRKKSSKEKVIRFTAMSKQIGYIVFVVVIVTILYSMYEMHRLGNLDPLQYLIVGALALGASYIGFYINMAKAEHIEDKKNEIKKEILLIKKDGVTPKEAERLEEIQLELEEMNTSLDELNTEEEVHYQ